MERWPGRTLLEQRGLGMAGMVVRAQRRLHALDAEPVIDGPRGGGARWRSKAHTIEGLIGLFEGRIVRGRC